MAALADLGQTAARGALVTLVSQGGRFVLQFGSLIVMARLLDPAAFGLVAMVTSVMGVAELIRDFGLSSAAISAKELSDAERTNLFWANVGIGTACSAVALACAPLIARIYGDPRVESIVLALGWLMVVSGIITQFQAELSRSLRFKALATVDVAAQALGIAAAITAASLGAGYWALVAQQITLVLTMCVLTVGFCRWRPGWPDRRTSIRRFFRFGGGVLGTQVLGYATNNADNVALGAVWGAGSLGIYSRAYQLMMVPINQINDPMARIILPVLSRVREDRQTYQRYVEKAQLIGSWLLATAFSLAAGLAVPLVAVLFGPKWSAVVPVFMVLAVGAVFRGIGLATYWIFLSSGHPGAQLKMYLITRPCMIAVILAGLPWGAVGVAAGHSIAFVGYWVVSLSWAAKAAGLRVRPLFGQALRSVAFISLPTGALAYVGSRLVHQSVLQLLVGGGLAAAYLAVVFILFPRERRELLGMGRRLRRMGTALNVGTASAG